MAIAFNNKVAAETLLYLGANPHVKDAYDKRPIDVCYVESLRSLLEIKMASVQAPVPGEMLQDANEETKSQRSGVSNQIRKMPSQMNRSMMGSTQPMTKEDKMFPLEPKDIKGNLSQKLVKMLQLQNLKGMTPLISTVDHGNYEIFRFIIDLTVHIQKS